MSHARILLGLIIGAATGVAVNGFFGAGNPTVEWFVVQFTEPVGELFLRLLLMTVVPLVFSSLIVGVAGVGEIRKLGRIGLKCLVYTVIISAISVAIGIGMANLVRPGKRIQPATADALVQRYSADASRRIQAASQTQPGGSGFMQVVRTLVPSNPIAAVASEPPNMLHLIFFAVVIGIAITLLPQSLTQPLVAILDALFQVSAKIIDMVIWFAPFAVGCLLFTTTSRFGFDLLLALAWYVFAVLSGLALHMFGGVFDLRCHTVSHLASRILSTGEDCNADSLFDFVFECNSPNGAPGF
jgi:DAACS family dicarboxylate/amino acid:cation (Na+ or H+) symporter